MFINSQKGSHGMFSKSGKQTLEKFQILLKKDEIINGINKKIKVNDIYAPDEANNLDTQEDEFKIYSQEQKDKIMSSENALNRFKAKVKDSKGSKIKKSKSKKEIRKHENPPCTKYNPNWQYINKKISWGVKWDTVKERNFSLLNGEKFNYKEELNLYKDKFYVDGKVFIDFNKQVKRGSFNNTKKEENDNLSKQMNKTTLISKGEESSIFPIITEANDTKSQIKKRGFSAKQKYNKIQAPDFRKTISRAHLDKLHDDKTTVIPFSLPKYGATWASKLYI